MKLWAIALVAAGLGASVDAAPSHRAGVLMPEPQPQQQQQHVEEPSALLQFASQMVHSPDLDKLDAAANQLPGQIGDLSEPSLPLELSEQEHNLFRMKDEQQAQLPKVERQEAEIQHLQELLQLKQSEQQAQKVQEKQAFFLK